MQQRGTLSQQVLLANHKLGPGDAVIVSLEKSSTPILDGWIEHVSGNSVFVAATDAIPKAICLSVLCHRNQ